MTGGACSSASESDGRRFNVALTTTYSVSIPARSGRTAIAALNGVVFSSCSTSARLACDCGASGSHHLALPGRKCARFNVVTPAAPSAELEHDVRSAQHGARLDATELHVRRDRYAAKMPCTGGELWLNCAPVPAHRIHVRERPE